MLVVIGGQGRMFLKLKIYVLDSATKLCEHKKVIQSQIIFYKMMMRIPQETADIST